MPSIQTHTTMNADDYKESAGSMPSLKQLYFILWTMGENFPAHRSFTGEDFEKHESYMRKAYSEGKLLMAALFENGSGFITLIEAETDYEVHKFVKNNPDVVAKRLQARIKNCKPLFWKNYLQ